MTRVHEREFGGKRTSSDKATGEGILRGDKGIKQGDELTFSQYLGRIIELMGSRTTTTRELEEMGYRLMPGFFRGVFAATQQPEIDGFCIVND